MRNLIVAATLVAAVTACGESAESFVARCQEAYGLSAALCMSSYMQGGNPNYGGGGAYTIVVYNQ